MAKFLEDIVKEDLERESTPGKSIGSGIRDFFDSPIIRHPVITSSIFFIGLEYLRYKYPEIIPSERINIPVAYGIYSIVGLIKEYILEGRGLKAKGIYSWFLQNPKIAAFFGAFSGGLITYYGEGKMNDIIPGNLPSLTLENSIHAGVITETLSRGLKNLRRIKQSIKRIKTSVYEKAYNFLFERPLALSSLVFMFSFYSYYDYRTRYRVHHPNTPFLSGNILEDLLDHTGSMFSIAARSGILTSAGFALSLVVSSLLHGHSLREYYHRSAKLIHTVLGNNDNSIEHQEQLVNLPNSAERNIEDLVDLGNNFYESEDRINAFKCYKRALRLFSKKGERINYVDFFRRTFGLDFISRGIRKLRFRNKLDDESTINRVFISLLNKDTNAVSYMKDAAERNPDDPKILYLYGKVLEILGYKESGRLQKLEAIRRVMSTSNLIEISSTKYRVALFDDELFGDEVVTKSGDRSSLEGFVKATNDVRSIAADFDDYDVPIPVGVIDHDEKSYYIMEMAHGELLSDRIREGKAEAEDFYNVADFMGLIHARIKPLDGERDYVEVINHRLTACGFSMDFVSRLCESIDSLKDSLENILRVSNRDGHPRNWIRSDYGGIIAIDIEGGRFVPLTFDTANLLGQYDVFDEEQEDLIFTKHLDAFKRYSVDNNDIDIPKYRLAYFNSLIIRAFEIYVQVKDTNREVMISSLENAKRAVVRVEREFSKYYGRKDESYKVIYEALEKLKIN
ncbi:hypothetical protein HYU23_01995 [Candidatus Woesearchaeota archaeon]|nr:hypothetical protein [Candidatus Woesearchaeota archaeon]